MIAISNHDAAWAGAFLLGEGHADIRKGGSVVLEAEQKDPLPLFQLARVLGCGAVAPRGTRDSWRWRVSAREEVRAVLEAVLPHLVGTKWAQWTVAQSALLGLVDAERAREAVRRLREGAGRAPIVVWESKRLRGLLRASEKKKK